MLQDDETIDVQQTCKQPNLQADKLVTQAEKRLKSISILNPTKFQDAVELYEQAASQYKLTKHWIQTAECFVRCAEICEKNKLDDACNHYANAGKAYKHVNVQQSIKMLTISVQLHQEAGRFSAAGKLCKEIASLHQKQMNNVGVVDALTKASEFYLAEDAITHANQCLLQVADLYAESDQYEKAFRLNETITKSSIDNEQTAGKWLVKDYLYKALLCQFVLLSSEYANIDHLQSKFEEYKDLVPSLDGSRECKFVEQLYQAFVDDDIEAFTNIIYKYNEIYKLDDFSTRLLYQIKMNLKGNGSENDLT